MNPQLAEIIIKFLNRVDIKGHESELMSQCKAAIRQLAQAPESPDPEDE